MGVTEVSSRFFIPPSVLPDISPTRGEIGYHFGFRQPPALQAKGHECGMISFLVGEMSGKTQGGNVKRLHFRQLPNHSRTALPVRTLSSAARQTASDLTASLM